jgi:hypothetical protein
MSDHGNRHRVDSPSLETLMLRGHPAAGQVGYLPLGPGPNTLGIPSWDPTRPLSQSTPNNRGAIRRIEAGQILNVADARMVPNVVGEDISVVLGLTVEGDDEDFLVDAPVDSLVRACVTWGLGSAEFRAELDWMNGTILTVPAEQINVRASYKREMLGSDPGPCPVFCLAAGFAYGRVGKNSNPARLTELVQLDAPGDSKQIRIPNFATSFTVVLVEPSTSAQLDVYGFGTGYSNRIMITSPMSNVGQFDVENAFPIRNGARFVKVTNVNTTGELIAYVIFGLSL